MKPVNYQPDLQGRSTVFHDCLMESQQIHSTSRFGGGRYFASGNSETGAKTNMSILESCMASKGYQLRKLTGGETFLSLISFPIALPFALLGADISNFY